MEKKRHEKTAAAKNPKILVIHGPNLNLLGKREPAHYGKKTLAAVNAELEKDGQRLGFHVETYQSNHEGAIIDHIQEAMETCAGVIINPAAFTHTSIAIRDALASLALPVVEVHISNIYKREPFRHRSLISDVVTGTLSGFGTEGYRMALRAMAVMIPGSR
ncbi:MAG: type II 3-dehydroquinate dehydratase [Deltaproteobacteria bacterium]|nr:type II 3-dehydroquinate dehydratase [Deltaproteobacteria bacterium]MBW2041974.1 type II 3-dehydroquinate dehydratase [Deltaproteobacteria bacterium]